MPTHEPGLSLLKSGSFLFTASLMKKYHRSLKVSPIFLAALILLSACGLPASPPQPAGDDPASTLLRLDPPDAAPGAPDLAALSARLQPDSLTVRLDFLEQPLVEFSTELQVQTSTAQASILVASDLSVSIHPANSPLLQSANAQWVTSTGLEVRISLSQPLPADTEVTVSLRDPVSGQPLDDILPTSLSAPAPAPAQVALIFWNVIPASTPAQALRRWDGAHTGPVGQRHGLKHLLDAASQSGLPITLLDALTPQSLAALELLGQVDTLRGLLQQGLVSFAQPSWGDPAACQAALQLSQSAAGEYGLNAAPGVISGPLPADCLTDAADFSFAWLGQSAQTIQTLHGVSLLPLPHPPYDSSAAKEFAFAQVDGKRLSNAILSQLLENALSEDPRRVLVLGGSLPDSLFAEQSIAPQLMQSIADMPWVRVLTLAELQQIPASQAAGLPQSCADLYCSPDSANLRAYTPAGQLAQMTLAETQSRLRSALQSQSISDPFTRQSWLAYLALTQPTSSPERGQLQANYLGQLGYPLYAQLWAQQPASIARCDIDLDWDAEAECVLANQSTLAIFEHRGAALVGLYTLQGQSLTRWIAPSSTLALGLGDSSAWDLTTGAFSDPGSLPGAFSFPQDTRVYSSQITSNRLIFKLPDSPDAKAFELGDDGTLLFTWAGESSQSLDLPMIPPQASTFSPGWAQSVTLQQDSDSMWLNSGAAVKLSLHQAQLVSTDSFLDTLEYIQQPENANQVFNEGHFLPYPLLHFRVQVEPGAAIRLWLEN